MPGHRVFEGERRDGGRLQQPRPAHLPGQPLGPGPALDHPHLRGLWPRRPSTPPPSPASPTASPPPTAGSSSGESRAPKRRPPREGPALPRHRRPPPRLRAPVRPSFPREVNDHLPAEREAPVERLMERMESHGVDGAVLVQIGGTSLEVHAYLLHCLREHPDRFLGIGLVPPDCEDPGGHMDRLAEASDGRVIGFRLSRLGGPADPFEPVDVRRLPVYPIWEHAARRDNVIWLYPRAVDAHVVPPPLRGLPPGSGRLQPPHGLPGAEVLVGREGPPPGRRADAAGDPLLDPGPEGGGASPATRGDATPTPTSTSTSPATTPSRSRATPTPT